MKDKYLSTDFEPALGGQAFHDLDPAEFSAAAPSLPVEEELVRDDVANEPAIAEHADADFWWRWFIARRDACTLSGNLGVTLLVAVLTGPLAIAGALFHGQSGWIAMVYVVVFGPAVEELLKQAGMTYLLEKKPYRIFSAWQFVFCAVCAGLAFATIENLVYIHVYASHMEAAAVERLAAFRWAVCTPLHTGCAVIASLGLVRVWRRHLATHRAPELSLAFPLYAVAVGIHGIYNLSATLFQSIFE